jgi:hypothetical protein
MKIEQILRAGPAVTWKSAPAQFVIAFQDCFLADGG